MPASFLGIAIAVSVIFGNTATQDSTNLIFGFSRINRFTIDFYNDAWEDSLSVYYYRRMDDSVPSHLPTYLPARFTCEKSGMVLDSVGVRYKGNSSFEAAGSGPKKPLKIKFDEFINQRFFGIKKLNFANSTRDPSFMREVITYEILSEYMPVPRTAYAQINADDQALGLYVQIEQIDYDYLLQHFNSPEGTLYKASEHGSPLLYEGGDTAFYEELYYLKTNRRTHDWFRFISFLEALDHSVFPENDVSTVIDMESVAVYFAMNTLLSNFDSYTGSGRNYYLYDDPVTERFHILPWDVNESFGVYSNGWDVISGPILDFPHAHRRPLLKACMEQDTVREYYIKKLVEMSSGTFSPSHISSLVDSLTPIIEPYVLADIHKLYDTELFYDNLEQDVFLGLDGLIPGIKSFAWARTEFIHERLEDENVGSIDTQKNAPVYRISVREHTTGVTLHFRRDMSEPVSVQVVTPAGRMVYSSILAPGTKEYTIAADQLNPGLYVCVIDSQNIPSTAVRIRIPTR
ncbi:MAG: CotH kinase family protein [Fibrobacterota bacterium]